MLKRTITYKDFNDQERTETFYFHIPVTEVLEMREVEGFEAVVQRILESGDRGGIVLELKKFILRAIGKRTEDGTGFVKNEEITEWFKNHAAFQVLYLELASDAEKAADFMIGVFPEEVRKQTEQLKKDSIVPISAEEAASRGINFPPPPPAS